MTRTENEMINTTRNFRVPPRRRQQQRPCVLLAATSGNSLPRFRDNLTVPYSRIKNPNKTAGNPNMGFPKERVWAVTTYHQRWILLQGTVQLLPLHIIFTHHVVESKLQAFLTPALDGHVWSALCSGPRIQLPIIITGIG